MEGLRGKTICSCSTERLCPARTGRGYSSSELDSEPKPTPNKIKECSQESGQSTNARIARAHFSYRIRTVTRLSVSWVIKESIETSDLSPESFVFVCASMHSLPSHESWQPVWLPHGLLQWYQETPALSSHCDERGRQEMQGPWTVDQLRLVWVSTAALWKPLYCIVWTRGITVENLGQLQACTHCIKLQCAA